MQQTAGARNDVIFHFRLSRPSPIRFMVCYKFLGEGCHRRNNARIWKNRRGLDYVRDWTGRTLRSTTDRESWIATLSDATNPRIRD